MLVAPGAAVLAMVVLLESRQPLALWPAFLIGLALGLVVWKARAATPGAAMLGGLLTLCLGLATPGWHSSLWPLLAMLVLTLGATRLGRVRAQELGTGEGKRGRTAAQVAANIGVAGLAISLVNAHGAIIALTAVSAALGEATADTLASELGQAFAGTPRLVTTLRRVPRGTDGGVTLAGTAIGVAGSAIVAAVAVAALALPWRAGLVAWGAAVFGLFFDSLLGATAERAGWLNNDAVNFLSTLSAAACALMLGDALL